MAIKAKETDGQGNEVGVLPLPDSKSSKTWWTVFGVCMLLTMWTRLHKVRSLEIKMNARFLTKMRN